MCFSAGLFVEKSAAAVSSVFLYELRMLIRLFCTLVSPKSVQTSIQQAHKQSSNMFLSAIVAHLEFFKYTWG